MEKFKSLLSLFPLLLFIIFSCNTDKNKEKDSFPILKGSYFGQNPPSIRPEVFLPGILNTDSLGAFCTVFSQDGNEFYFVRYFRNNERPGVLAYMKQEKNIWSPPETLQFTSGIVSSPKIWLQVKTKFKLHF